MQEVVSGEARAEAPTATKPEAAGYSVISTEQTINHPERPGAPLPAVCETDPTRCGSFLSSDGPCARYSRRGCVLRHQAGYQEVTDATPATRTPGPAAMFSSDSVEWYTPPKIIEAVRELFGGTIDLDPCSNAKGAAANVPARVHYTQEDNGLFQPWFGNVYMNPPYGAREIVPWIERVRMEYEARRVTAAVVLVKAATSARWFRTLSPKYIRCEVAGRLKFSGHPDSAPFSSVLFYLGDDVQRFADVFGRHGVIVGPWAAVRKTEEVTA